MRYFAIAYAIAIGAAFLPLEPVWLKWIVAVVLHRHLRLVREGPLRGRPGRRRGRTSRRCASTASTAARTRTTRPCPRLRVVNLQVLAALGADRRSAPSSSSTPSSTSPASSASTSVLLALVIAPIATELPEKFNSVIWVRQGKDTLAMGNITGAMVFQSTIPTVVALVFASSSWVAEDGLLRRLRLGRHRLPVVRGHLHPDGPPGRPARPGAARRRRLLPGLPGPRRSAVVMGAFG